MSRKASKRPISYADSSDGGDSAESEADVSLSEADSEDELSPSEEADSPPKKSKKTAAPAKGKAAAKTSTPSKGKKEPAAAKKTPSSSSAAKPAASSSSSSLAPTASAAAAAVPTTSRGGAAGGVDITQGPPVTTDAAAKKLLLQYMTLQNRPYSLLQVFENLHKRIPKATLERVLAALSGPGAGLVCKEYGKAKIYFVDQSTLSCDYTADQLQTLIDQNEERKESIDRLAAEEKASKAELAKLTAEPSDEDLDKVLEELEQRVAGKQARVSSLTSSNVFAADPKALQNAIKKFNFYRQAWQQRRAQCLEAVDTLSEAMNKKRKDLMTDLCLETDEDAGQSLPPVLKEPNIK